MSSVRIGAKMAFFRGFGPRRAAVWAEQPFFSFAIIFNHPKEHSLRVSALYSKIFLNYTFGLDILRSVKMATALECFALPVGLDSIVYLPTGEANFQGG